MQKSGIIALLLVLLVVAGCGPQYDNLGRVEGTVTLDGEPVENAVLTFQPEHARPSYGRTDENGHYELVYTDNAKGAVIGTHRVSISTQSEGDPDAGIEASAERIPNKYKGSRSELTAEVEAGSNTIDFTLTTEGSTVEQETGA